LHVFSSSLRPSSGRRRTKGDIVKAFDGKAIRSATKLRNLVGLTPLGSRVELRLERNGNLMSAGVDVAPAKVTPQHAGN
jgi:serine protease Do